MTHMTHMTVESTNPLDAILVFGQAKQIAKSILSTEQGRVSEILRRDAEIEEKAARLFEIIELNQEYKTMRRREEGCIMIPPPPIPSALYCPPIVWLIMLILAAKV